jgi:DNA-binding SARP family transcriptional activator
VEFRILGSLQVVTEDGRQLRFGPRQTKVLAVLLLSAGRVLSVHDLIDAVWEGDPPATARRQIQNCVWSLRKHLAILSEGPGYRILVGGGQLDAQLFEDLLAEARASAAGGQATRAAGQLTAALVAEQRLSSFPHPRRTGTSGCRRSAGAGCPWRSSRRWQCRGSRRSAGYQSRTHVGAGIRSRRRS